MKLTQNMLDGMDVSRVVAPMVNQSDAPFRALCLKYGATCCYTEMLYSSRIVDEPNYLDAYLPECDDSLLPEVQRRGVVVQVCGNDPKVLGEAVRMISGTNRARAVDLNLGCPQERAKAGVYGSYLLDKCHWETVFACVREMSKHSLPVFCKLRLLDGGAGVSGLEHTKQFCRGLCIAGAQLICVHGRIRGSTTNRRCGAADLQAVSEVAELLRREFNLPVVSNGNLRCREDIAIALQQSCPAVGVMSAEGVLADPSLFANEQASLLTLFIEYCSLSNKYKQLGGWKGMDAFEADKRQESKQIYIARQHLTWMLGKSGRGRLVRFKYIADSYKKQVHLLDELNSAKTMEDLIVIANKCLP